MSSNPRYGKGDRYRVLDMKKYRAEYDRIFGKKTTRRIRPKKAK